MTGRRLGAGVKVSASLTLIAALRSPRGGGGWKLHALDNFIISLPTLKSRAYTIIELQSERLLFTCFRPLIHNTNNIRDFSPLGLIKINSFNRLSIRKLKKIYYSGYLSLFQKKRRFMGNIFFAILHTSLILMSIHFWWKYCGGLITFFLPRVTKCIFSHI